MNDVLGWKNHLFHYLVVLNLFLKLFHLTFLKSILHYKRDLTQYFKQIISCREFLCLFFFLKKVFGM